jgi:hypothetical protein
MKRVLIFAVLITLSLAAGFYAGGDAASPTAGAVLNSSHGRLALTGH